MITGRSARLLPLLVVLVAVALPGARAAAAGAIASQHPLATAAGEEVLAAGGNAFDAAVAISATLAVVEPYGSGIGGGGFWLLHQAASGREVMVDGRETAPAASTRDMYLDGAGEVDRDRVMNGPLAAGIPGQPAALVHIAERYGELSIARSLEPAIRHARDGFPVDERYRLLAGFREDMLNRWPAAAEIFLVDGKVPPLDHMIRQPDLAATLETLARHGFDGFYDGPVASRLVEGVRAEGGIWTRRDLRSYEVVEREPVTGEYRGMRIVSAPPPSSGGVAVVQMLNILAGYDLDGLDEAARAHLIIEAMRRAYHDRARYLGDSDFVDVPVDRLTDPAYAAGLRATVRGDQATPSRVFVGLPAGDGGPDTTHFSVVDARGNRVAATLSVNWPFGAAFMPPGTGVVLNNEMDDFAALPGEPNAYGLVQGEANAIEPGKRMLSSMTPTFLEHDGRSAVLGSPGGSRIINMVLLGALAFHAGADAATMVGLPRYHHQYLPDVVEHEPDALPATVRAQLRERGHELAELDRTWGNMQVVIDDVRTGLDAAADPRGIGSAAVEGRVGSH